MSSNRLFQDEQTRVRVAVFGMTILGFSVSLLLWSRLKLISEFPKSAYAGSEQSQIDSASKAAGKQAGDSRAVEQGNSRQNPR